MKKDEIYRRVGEAGLPPIMKQIELLNRKFTIKGLRLESYEEDNGEARDYFIATVQLNGKEGLYYMSGVAVMPKLEALADIKGGLPSDWTLVKKKSRGGSRYDIQEPAAPKPGELFEREQGGGE